MKKGILFDLDGTLIDSMQVWMNLDRSFVESKGKIYDPTITDALKALSFEEVPPFFKTMGIETSTEELWDHMRTQLEEGYNASIPLKYYVLETIEQLKNRGFVMAITTATQSPLAMLAVERLGLLPYMEFVLTPDRAEIGKDNPAFFKIAASQLGLEPEQIYVFDDALYAIKNALEVGMTPIGVYDPTSFEDWKTIQDLSSQSIMSFEELDMEKL